MVKLLESVDLLRGFANWMIADRGLSVVTASKRITAANMVAKSVYRLTIDKPTATELKRLRDSHDAQRPTSRRDPAERTERRIPSIDELNALANAVHVARWPYGKHAPFFWLGFIRFAAMVGFRSRDIVSTIARKPGLLKRDVVFDARCPLADVSHALGTPLNSPHGWLNYPIGKDSHSDCRRILLPMPVWLRRWIEHFSTLSADPDRVFPPMRRQSLDAKTYGRTWAAIVQAAGVDSRIVISEGTGGKIAVRKFAANWWALATLRTRSDAALADKMTHYILHHAEVTTATRHYLNTQAAVLPLMLELLPMFPVPGADCEIHPPD